MKPAFCDKHGVQQFVLTSPRLTAAIGQGEVIEAKNVSKLQIEPLGNKFEHFLDSEFLKEFQINLSDVKIVLKDRDKVSKQLNDRLIVQKILAKMEWVCLVCLNTLVHKGAQKQKFFATHSRSD